MRRLSDRELKEPRLAPVPRSRQRGDDAAVARDLRAHR